MNGFIEFIGFVESISLISRLIWFLWFIWFVWRHYSLREWKKDCVWNLALRTGSEASHVISWKSHALLAKVHNHPAFFLGGPTKDRSLILYLPTSRIVKLFGNLLLSTPTKNLFTASKI